VLRPGGYWILSGPPINWNKYWKGWERTKEDLNAEQQAIEAVARSLCWTKVKEAGDIAVWQKPYNHAGCKASKSSRPFCSRKNPDAAWLVPGPPPPPPPQHTHTHTFDASVPYDRA
jgi:hypothetical protein